MSLFGADKGEKFNVDKTHRIFLWRIWDESLPLVLFIGLNPSTADATKDDATIRRCKRFAKDWGYGGFYMMNLYSIISTDPKLLQTTERPIDDNYDAEMRYIAGKCKLIVFCWGAFKGIVERARVIEKMFPSGMCFGKTKGGFPKHPCRLAANLKPISF